MYNIYDRGDIILKSDQLYMKFASDDSFHRTF